MKRSAVYAGVAASSASVLILEVALTRVFAVTQFYHFAFLVVSLALLGFGASGSALAVFPALGRGGPRRWALLTALQGATAFGAPAAANALPLDTYAIAWDHIQILYLITYYLVLAVPFFLGGAVIGVLLSAMPSHRVYASSLAGSGAGCLVGLAGIPLWGGMGTIAAAGAVAAIGAIAFAVASTPLPRPEVLAATVLAVALAALTVVPVPNLRLSPYKSLSGALRYPDAEVVGTDWELTARVDRIHSAGIRSLPGLSYTYGGAPPPQEGLTFDGDDLAPIPLVAPGEADFAGHLLGSLPFRLIPGAEVLVLNARGGLEVLVALATGAATVTAVEPHRAATAAVRAATPLYEDDRVTVEATEPRAYVERTGRHFDIVHLVLSSSYRPVFSGAYSLAEDYGLTIEAIDAYLDRLRPGGILAVSRWIQTPPSETMRVVALAGEAARRNNLDPAATVVVLRGYATGLVLLRPSGFGDTDLAVVESFAAGQRFDIVAAPGLAAADANLFNLLPTDPYYPLARALLSDDPSGAYRSADFDLTPPTDDHPFFGHFFRWNQASEVLDSLGRTWQPFGGAGYFVLVALLGLSVAGALALIAAPLAVARIGRRPDRKGHRAWTLGYFGLLGIGFLLVEIPLIQRFILMMGSPTAALAVVLFALLVASGAGSLASRRVPWRGTAMLLTIMVIASPFVLDAVDGPILGTPFWVRVAAGALLLAPLGFAMGVMFPRGLARLEEAAPRLVPWAWAINGTMSVISASAAALLALTFGFRWVLWAGALCYTLCVPLTDRG
jgi:hypothetical protein